MVRELDVQIRTTRIEQDFEDAIHGIAVYLHPRARKWSVLNQIEQAIHEARARTRCL